MKYKQLITDIREQIQDQERRNVKPTLIVIDRLSWYTILGDGREHLEMAYELKSGPDRLFGLAVGVTNNDDKFIEVK